MFTQTNRDIRFSSVANGDDNDDDGSSHHGLSVSPVHPDRAWRAAGRLCCRVGTIAIHYRCSSELDASSELQVTNRHQYWPYGMGRAIDEPSFADLFRKKKKC
uniref:Uncharacterized protein n=1 Tax=Anopheles melas TaxID=34690 RepID=A0A182UAL9_9DIPT